MIVSKLRRLGMNVAFVSGLMANRVPIIVAELGPDVDPIIAPFLPGGRSGGAQPHRDTSREAHLNLAVLALGTLAVQ